MPVDFRTKQLRVNQIINSGSASTSPLLIYGMGSVSNEVGGFNVSHFITGSDTWLFISGTAGSKNSSSRGVVTFKGDVVVSGTIYDSAGTAYSAGGGGGGGTSNWNELAPSPRLNSTASVAIAGGLGSSYAAQSAGSDVFFFVSGTRSASTANAKIALFGGDIISSGSLTLGQGGNSSLTGSGDFYLNFGQNSALYLKSTNQTTSQASAIFYDSNSAYSLEVSGGMIVNANKVGGGNGDFLVYHPSNKTAIWSDSSASRTFVSGTQVTVNKMTVHGGSDVNFFVDGTINSRGTTTRGTSVFGGDIVVSGSQLIGGNVTGSNAKFAGDVEVNGGDITTTASTFNLATSAATLNLGSSAGKVVVLGDLEVQGTTVTVDATNVTIEDPLIGLGFTTGSVAGSAGDRGFIGGITGAGNNVAFAWSNNSGSFVATKTTSTAGATSVVVGGLQPIRASSFQVNGTTATITSSNGSTLTLSGTAIVLNASGSGLVKFQEDGNNYVEFSRQSGYSAQIRAIEASFPSLYLSGNSVHIDSYSGLTWFDSNSSGGLAVDSSNASSPKILGRLGSGQSVNLTISGSDLVLGSNTGQVLLYRGTSEFLRATYNGTSDSAISAQSLNLSVGGTASTQLSGSNVTINYGTGSINFQRNSSNFLTVVSGSGQDANVRAASGKSLTLSSDSVTRLSGSNVQVTGSLIAQSITGSLRKTVGNLDFITGSGVTVNYNSSGQWELTASGGGGTPAGSNTQVQFNADGAFAATSGLTFATGSSSLTISGDLAVNGGDITTTESAATIFSTNVSSLSLASAASTVSVGGSSSSTAFTLNVAASRTGNSTLNLGTGATSTGNAKNVNIGQGGDPGSTTNIRLGTTDTAGTSNIFMSGSVYITGSVGMKGSIIPDAHNTYTLGTTDIRWAHIYTGDLHLRNERGDWTVIEENDFLRIVNNKTGKNYKMMMQLIND